MIFFEKLTFIGRLISVLFLVQSSWSKIWSQPFTEYKDLSCKDGYIDALPESSVEVNYKLQTPEKRKISLESFFKICYNDVGYYKDGRHCYDHDNAGNYLEKLYVNGCPPVSWQTAAVCAFISGEDLMKYISIPRDKREYEELKRAVENRVLVCNISDLDGEVKKRYCELREAQKDMQPGTERTKHEYRKGFYDRLCQDELELDLDSSEPDKKNAAEKDLADKQNLIKQNAYVVAKSKDRRYDRSVILIVSGGDLDSCLSLYDVVVVNDSEVSDREEPKKQEITQTTEVSGIDLNNLGQLSADKPSIREVRSTPTPAKPEFTSTTTIPTFTPMPRFISDFTPMPRFISDSTPMPRINPSFTTTSPIVTPILTSTTTIPSFNQNPQPPVTRPTDVPNTNKTNSCWESFIYIISFQWFFDFLKLIWKIASLILTSLFKK